jgi:hypothetical protein
VYAAEDLAEELQETGLTPETDTWAVWEDDRLVAYGQLRGGRRRARHLDRRARGGGTRRAQQRLRGPLGLRRDPGRAR